MQLNKDLKAIAYLTILSILATPIIYKIVFAAPGWWLN